MIKLYSRHTLTDARWGAEKSFDLDALREDLEKAFKTAGVNETWMADHIIVTLAAQSTADYSHNPSGNTQEQADQTKGVDFVVCRMLVDAGYPDVAHAFAELKRMSLPTASNNGAPWTEARIENVLRDTIPLSESARKRLSKQVVKKLETLDFAKASDELIRQLGEHILTTCAETERKRHHSQATANWLAAPGYWEGCFAGETAKLITDGILDLRPGTDLFPAPRGSVFLDTLARLCAQDALLTELVFFPRAEKACCQAAEAIRQLLNQSEADRSARPPGHLIVKGIRESIGHYFQVAGPKQSQRLATELGNGIRLALAEYDTLDLIVSIQS